MRIMLWKGPSTLFGRVIRLKTGSAYTHAELLFEDGMRFGVEASIKARFYTADDGWWKEDEWDVISIASGDEPAVRAFCESAGGADYDWTGIVMSQMLPWGREDPDKWFCSELCTAALQAGKFTQVVGLKPHLTSPPKLAAALLAGGGSYVQPIARILKSAP